MLGHADALMLIHQRQGRISRHGGNMLLIAFYAMQVSTQEYLGRQMNIALQNAEDMHQINGKHLKVLLLDSVL
jgi:hypothetical protein